jgi:flavorubredoxin
LSRERNEWRVILTSVFVAYDSKYGNTKRAAETLAEGLRNVEGVVVSLASVKEVDMSRLAEYGVLVLGAPNHMASPSRAMMKFVDRLASLNLKAKNVAVFGTYSGRVRESDRAVRKMEKKLKEKASEINLLSPSLSMRVLGVTGPVFEGELDRCREFGRRIANQVNQEQ